MIYSGTLRFQCAGQPDRAATNDDNGEICSFHVDKYKLNLIAEALQADGIYLFLINLNFPAMRRLLLLLFALVSVIACNNDNKVGNGNDKGGQNDNKAQKNDRDDDINNEVDRKENENNSRENKDTENNKQYTWTKTEQNKFMEECSRESEENVDQGKLIDFCSCMLTQAQKYYPGYSQMDDKSNEEDDREIFAKCISNYGADVE
jgi:hypothetical protein